VELHLEFAQERGDLPFDILRVVAAVPRNAQLPFDQTSMWSQRASEGASTGAIPEVLSAPARFNRLSGCDAHIERPATRGLPDHVDTRSGWKVCVGNP